MPRRSVAGVLGASAGVLSARSGAASRLLFDSARIYRMDVPYEQQAITDAILDLIQVNKFRACYIRPLMYRGYHTLGVNPLLTIAGLAERCCELMLSGNGSSHALTRDGGSGVGLTAAPSSPAE